MKKLPRFVHAPGLVMIALLVFGFVLTLANPGARRAPEDKDLLSGAWADAYQADYTQSLPVRRPAVTLWGVIRYLAFGEGEPGVLVGEDGRLFTTEEFALPGDPESVAELHVDRIAAVGEVLASRGIYVVVALVPAKARVYRDSLGRYRYPEALRPRYQRIHRELGELGIPAPDLFTAFEEARLHGDVFLRTDTHWTPFGATVAAKAVADVVDPLLEELGADRGRFRRHTGNPMPYHGDLLRYIPLGPFLDAVGPEPDMVAVPETERLDEPSYGLFGELSIPVALVGTSYSAAEPWDFAGALEAALQVDVLNAARAGEGPVAPMDTLLADGTLEDAKVKLVVWEIPERYVIAPTQ
jgi:alginate O-acetyltransferase complex protein AlgJ